MVVELLTDQTACFQASVIRFHDNIQEDHRYVGSRPEDLDPFCAGFSREELESGPFVPKALQTKAGDRMDIRLVIHDEDVGVVGLRKQERRHQTF